MSRADDDKMPADPFTELAQSAASIHELYLSNRHAGFTAKQAMYLVGCMLTGNPGDAPDDLTNRDTPD